MRILPFGDGLVLGEGASGGFRAPLEEMLIASSVDFEFVGRRTENSFEMKYPCHEGWSRASLTYLREECLGPALALEPDILLIYAGMEDIALIPDAGIAVARLEKLIRTAQVSRPSCRILCSQLIPSRDYGSEQKVKRFNTGLGALMESLAQKDGNAARLKMHARVKTETLNELGMPDERGYLSMAEIWFKAIEEIRRRTEERVDESK